MRNTLQKKHMWLFLIVMLTVMLTAPLFHVPLGRDQGIFAYVADGILRGLSPYTHSFDLKPPGIFFIYALNFSLLGESAQSVYIGALLYRILTLLAIYIAGKKMYGERTGLSASLLYGIFSSLVFGRIWRSAQTETFMVLPLVLACYFFIRSEEKDRYPFLCGISTGAAFIIKYSAGFIVIPIAAYWLFRRDRRKTILCLCGFLLSLIPVVIYFYSHNSLYDLYMVTLKFNIFHVTRRFDAVTMWHKFLRYGIKIRREMHVLLILPCLFLFLRKQNGKFYNILAVWLLSSFLSILIQGKFWFYHWIVLLGPLSLMAGWQAVWLYDQFAKTKIGKNAILILYAAAFMFTMKTSHFRYRISRNIRYLTHSISRKDFLLPFDNLANGLSFSNTEKMAKYIRRNTTANETVWIFGHESLVYFLAGRRSPTRFQWDYPLTIDVPGAEEIKKDFLKTCLTEINQKKPKIIFIMQNDRNPIEREDSVIQWKAVPELVEFLSKNYTFAQESYNALIYWRKDETT